MNPSADFPSALHERINVADFSGIALGATEPNLTELVGKVEEELFATQTKLGIGASTPTLGKALIGIGVGQSAWGDIGGLGSFPVSNYGAVGDGTTDDHDAIQDAIDACIAAGGGFVDFNGAIYRSIGSLDWDSSVTFRGVAMESSVLHFTDTSANGLVATDGSSLNIMNMTIRGPGSGTGIGIVLAWSGAGNIPFLNWENVDVKEWGSDGIKIQTPIVSVFNKVISRDNGGHGFNWHHAGTSSAFIGCWARDNAQAGYRFFESVYISLSGCASDNNGVNYWCEDAQSIGFFACGSEGALMNDATYNGYGWKIDNCSNVVIDPGWVTDNRNLGIWVTGGSQAIYINAADNTPNGTAVNFIKVDSGCNVLIANMHNTTANSLAAGTTSIINDGAGGISGVDVFVQSATATTVPVFNANKALISSAVTPTELGYLSGVSSAIQTQLGNKQALDATLTALAGVTTAADKLIYATGSDAFTTTDLTSTARNLLDDTSTSAMRTTLGLAIGTDVQAQDPELAAIAGLTSAADRLPYFTGSGAAALATFTSAARNLLDDTTAAAMATTLGLGTGDSPTFAGLTAPSLTAASGHLTLSAGSSSLVKTSVLRQNNTSNAYQIGNTVILTGWGVFTAGAASNKSEGVTFGITFAARPIVTISYGGDDSAGGTTYGDGGNEDKGPVAIKAHSITTTGFTAHVHTSDGTSWAAGSTVFYQWIAIGEI